MQRRKLLKGLLAAGLAERLVFLRQAWAAGSKLAKPGFYQLQGTVTVNGRPAREGMTLEPGDRVVTGANSQAIYVIGQDAYLQRDNSTVDIAGDILRSGLRMLNGKLLSVFGKGDKRIETGVATIGIRGTGCYLETDANRSYFCLCYGIADVARIGDEQQVRRVQTTHHEQPLNLYADAAKGIQAAAMVNHSDAELILLEQLVGRIPPFVGKSGYSYNY
jgi:hypothetical protein